MSFVSFQWEKEFFADGVGSKEEKQTFLASWNPTCPVAMEAFL